jgi:protein SCO1/2
MIRLMLLLAALALAAPASAAELPGDSVYRLSDVYTDQDGRAFRLADGRGKVRLATMFYTSCPYICPLIIDSAKGVEHALTPAERDRLAILLVSLDPARDDPAALKRIAAKRRLDPARWTLARTEAAGVRRTAAVLGIRYRALADGEFNHSSALVLLDGEGRVLARTEQLGAVPDPAFLAAVKTALAAPAR